MTLYCLIVATRQRAEMPFERRLVTMLAANWQVFSRSPACSGLNSWRVTQRKVVCLVWTLTTVLIVFAGLGSLLVSILCPELTIDGVECQTLF